MNSEQMKQMVREMGEHAGRTFDREFLDACTYAVDTGREEPKTATAVLAQMESVQEQMRYARESHESLRRAGLLESAQEQQERYKREAPRMEQQMRYAREADERSSRYQQMIDRAVSRFQQGPVLRLKKPDPAPLTFTALQETVLPDLYGKKQHAQLLAAQRKREADAAARLREETNNKIGGLLRGFLGARREEEL